MKSDGPDDAADARTRPILAFRSNCPVPTPRRAFPVRIRRAHIARVDFRFHLAG